MPPVQRSRIASSRDTRAPHGLRHSRSSSVGKAAPATRRETVGGRPLYAAHSSAGPADQVLTAGSALAIARKQGPGRASRHCRGPGTSRVSRLANRRCTAPRGPRLAFVLARASGPRRRGCLWSESGGASAGRVAVVLMLAASRLLASTDRAEVGRGALAGGGTPPAQKGVGARHDSESCDVAEPGVCCSVAVQVRGWSTVAGCRAAVRTGDAGRRVGGCCDGSEGSAGCAWAVA